MINKHILEKKLNTINAELIFLKSLLKTNKKKFHGEKSKKPSKGWWNKMIKDIEKDNPDYTEEQVTKTVGRIWSDLSDKKKSEIREREGKVYGVKKQADSGSEHSFYSVTSPSGEKIKVTPGQLAMSGGWVTDSKGKKFKPTEFKPESLESKVASRKKAIKEVLDGEIHSLIQQVRAEAEGGYPAEGRIKELIDSINAELEKVKDKYGEDSSIYQRLASSSGLAEVYEIARKYR